MGGRLDGGRPYKEALGVTSNQGANLLALVGSSGARAPADVGRQDNVLEIGEGMIVRKRLFDEHIQSRPGDLARSQGLEHGILVDDPAAARIEQIGSRLHSPEPLCVDQLLGLQRVGDVERLDPGVKRIMNPHTYHVSLTQRLWDLKQALIQAAKGTL